VLVIEDDEWVARLLAVAIREAGFKVEVCPEAQLGLDFAIERTPDCIVCDIDLPDHDGFWVAQKVRTLPSRVSVTPFLFLSGLDDQASRLQGFHVGADVYMTKPFRVDEVVAQVTALVQMAARLRERRDTLLSIPPEDASAIEGDLAQMSIATVLTVLEMERRSGTFEVSSKKRRARLELAGGTAAGGSIGGDEVKSIESLSTMLGWTVGRFKFTPVELEGEPPSGPSIGGLLMEACRIADEAAAGMSKPPSARHMPKTKLIAPALGGPSLGLGDMTPPAPAKPVQKTGSQPASSDEPSSGRAQLGSAPEIEMAELDEEEAAPISLAESDLQSVPPGEEEAVDSGWGSEPPLAISVPPPPPPRKAVLPPSGEPNADSKSGSGGSTIAKPKLPKPPRVPGAAPKHKKKS